MATFQMNDIPNFDNIAGVRNYLYQLTEQLSYMYSHLGEKNFTDSDWEKITATPTASEVGALSDDTTLTNLSGVLSVKNGGQGNSTLAANELLLGNDADAVSSLGFPATAGSVLRQGTSGSPYWTTIAALLTALGNAGLGSTFSTWQDWGKILDSNYNFHYYANLVMTVLSQNHVALHMTGKMGTSCNSSSYYQYGISIAQLTSFITAKLATLGFTVASVSYNSKSPWLAWNYTNGLLMYDSMAYGTCYEVDTTNGVLRPARVWDTSGDIGGWGIGTWINAAYFDTTIYADIS